MMRAGGTVNLGNADQTSGDSTNVTNFQNVDAAAVSTAVSITGSSSANILANILTGGSGNDTNQPRSSPRGQRHDRWRGRRRCDRGTGGGNDTVSYYAIETSIDGGAAPM